MSETCKLVDKNIRKREKENIRNKKKSKCVASLPLMYGHMIEDNGTSRDLARARSLVCVSRFYGNIIREMSVGFSHLVIGSHKHYRCTVVGTHKYLSVPDGVQ